jgi:hypothetical protein
VVKPKLRHYLKRTEQISKQFGLGLIYRAILPVRLPQKVATVKEYFHGREATGDSVTWLRNSQEQLNRLPLNVDDAISPEFIECQSTRRPAEFLVRLKQGRVFGFGNVATADDIQLADLAGDQLEQASRSMVFRLGGMKRPESVSGRLAVLSTRGSANYYHWLYDQFSRLHSLDVREVDGVYVDASKSFQRAYLALAGFRSEQIVQAGRWRHLQPEQLLAASTPGNLGQPTEEAIAFLRRVAGRVSPSGSEYSTRIYISRGDVPRRRVTNEAEVIETLRPFGFTPITLSGLSVEQQIRTFAKAEYVIAPHGAGLSNLAYSRPGTTVIELFAPRYVNVCYWILANRCQHRYCYLMGERNGYAPEELGRNNASFVGDWLTVPLQPLRDLVASCSSLRQSILGAA